MAATASSPTKQPVESSHTQDDIKSASEKPSKEVGTADSSGDGVPARISTPTTTAEGGGGGQKKPKQLSKKQASKRALMLEASSQPSAVWSRSGGGTGTGASTSGSGGGSGVIANRRATLLLGGLAKQKKAELDASLHKTKKKK